ncbi:MAG: DUF4190 domain-containing protein [Anaerolineales bacterium]|nr:MAG: DUF4190 domain-containing protein [Anaerolineales bacterium]
MSEQPQAYGQGYGPSETNSMAVISLISSILGLTFLPAIGSIVGLILGYMARNQIRESGGRMGGEGLAKGGIILGWVGILGGLIIACLIVLLTLGVFTFTLPVGIGVCGGLGNTY